jgi:hypothetical protein
VERRSPQLRAAVIVYYLAFLLFCTGPFVAVLGGGRVGAYVCVVGFSLLLVAHRLFGLIGARMTRLQPWPLGNALAGVGYAAALALLFGGLFAAMTGARVGAYVLLAGLGVQLGCDLGLGVRSYRATMRRPWPKVAPIVDDDDW